MTLQLPQAGQIFLDHVAHFVPDIVSAARDLTALGFLATPFVHQQKAGPDGTPVPAGTGNRCAMLRQGYLELLAVTDDTPLSRQFRRQLDRYAGVHLVAFASARAPAEHRRLAAAGFEPLPPVRLERPVDMPEGPSRARFTVVRVPPAAMPEGRIQFLTHHTEGAVWQPRWLDHPNRAGGLDAVVMAVEDPDEAAARYGRFTGCSVEAPADDHRVVRLARGSLHLASAARAAALLPGGAAPGLPWIAGYSLVSDDLEATRRWLGNAARPDHRGLLVPLPPSLGGTILFVARPGAFG